MYADDDGVIKRIGAGVRVEAAHGAQIQYCGSLYCCQ